MYKNILLFITIAIGIIQLFSYTTVHKDKLLYEDYDKVRLVVKYPFYNDANVEKAKIIAQLTSKFIEKENISDTILLEFNLAQYFQNNKYEILDKSSLNNFRLLTLGYGFKTDSVILLRQQNDKKDNVLTYRLQSNNVDILNSLKVINYGLSNDFKEVVNKTEVEDYVNDSIEKHILLFESLKTQKIDSIKKSKVENNTKIILHNKILIDSVGHVSISFVKNRYILENRITSKEFNDFNCLVKLPEGLLVGLDSSHLMYLGVYDNEVSVFKHENRLGNPLQIIHYGSIKNTLSKGQYYIASPYRNRTYYILDTIDKTFEEY